MKTLKIIIGILFQIVFVPAFLLVLYLGLIYLTNGLGMGLVAGLLSIFTTLILLFYRYKKTRKTYQKVTFLSSLIPGIIFIAFVAYTLVPVAYSGSIPKFPDPKGVDVKYWKLETGSSIAYYKLSAKSGITKKSTPIIFLHGGPGAYVRQIEINFFTLFTNDGYDVYLYDQAGSGRSGLLPKNAYSHERNIKDFEAIINTINAKQYIVIGQSYGGSLLAHITADENLNKRIAKAIYAEPGASVSSDLDEDKKTFSRSPNALTDDINLPVRLLISILISPKGEFTSQNEIINYFFDHQQLIQDLFTESFPEKDKGRIPRVDLSVINFAANGAIKLNSTKPSEELSLAYKKYRIPSLLILGESSYVERNAPMDLLKINENITEVQYIKGVGHILWDGLDNNNRRIKKVIDDFLNNTISDIPNYPNRSQINDFLNKKL
ncbi:alpha/beta fold hydrolase [Sphingobacterium siyangense]|uniref:alpha/beta fold hydrolase n=1 Tax=Sphingobacterium siyangense TaxID=459529 RepID=UPI00196488AD|nr:alpha/beta hydrolase [Sphingobacterium siyangense]QRY55871.1 alpha/beta hydrolase [Sphingobacterium siyangense]